MEISPFVFAQAVLCVVGFGAHMNFALERLGPPPEHQVYHLVERLMSDKLMPLAKQKMSLMSCPRRRSLYQEIKGETASARRVILSSNSDLAGFIRRHKAINPYEKELGD
jgi:hypothetical protein